MLSVKEKPNLGKADKQALIDMVLSGISIKEVSDLFKLRVSQVKDILYGQ